VLEDQRRLLNRTIRALEVAEGELDSSPDQTSDTLRTLLEVIGMQNSVEEMRKYYSDDVWDAWRHHYEDWPSPAWRELYRDINLALDDAPALDPARAGLPWTAARPGSAPSGLGCGRHGPIASTGLRHCARRSRPVASIAP
jgi:hypothetical protein